MSKLIRILIVFLFLVFFLAGYFFVRSNMSPVEIWIGFSLSARPIGQWLLITFLLGGILGLSVGIGLFKRFQHKIQISMLKSQNEKLLRENSQLKKGSLKEYIKE